MRQALIGLIVLVVVLVGAALIAPRFIDWNRFRPNVIAAVAQATGREMVIDGDLSLALLPAPSLSVRAVRLANVPGASTADLLRLKALEIKVALVPLAAGRLQVESVRLVDPELFLEMLPDGRGNWRLAEASELSSQQTPAERRSDDRATWSLEDVRVENASVVFRNRASGTEERISKLFAVASASSSKGPLAASGTLSVRGVPLAFDARIGTFAGNGAVPIRRLELGLQDGSARFAFTGRLVDDHTERKLTGKLSLEADNLAGLLGRLAPALRSPRALAVPATLGAAVEASSSGAALNDVTLRLAGTQITGAVSTSFANGFHFDAAMAANRLNVDALLAAAKMGQGIPDGATASRPSGHGEAASWLATHVSGSLSIEFDGVTYNGGVLRQVQLAAEMAEGNVTLTRAGALLPGGTNLNLRGAAAIVGDQPQFDGHLELASDNLRRLLSWLGLDHSEVPAGPTQQCGLDGRGAPDPGPAAAPRCEVYGSTPLPWRGA